MTANFERLTSKSSATTGMASQGCASSLARFSFLLLLLTSLLSPSDAHKVSLTLYYETLCPYCSNFIVNDLIKLIEDDDLFSIVDIRLVPYGNAKIGTNNTISCQHGPSECLLNTVEACAIDIWPDLSEHFPFINCVETLVYEHKYAEWESCFDKLGLDSKLIADCYNSGRGTELELQYAAETDALQPPHKYVPWVTVDGQPLYEDYENFVSYICKAYTGTVVTKACSELSSTATGNKLVNPVCYAKETNLSGVKSAVAWWMSQFNMAFSS